jgi:MFS family permease
MSVPGQLTRQQLSVLILALMATSMGQSLVFAILAPLGREVNLQEVQITSIIGLSSLIFGLASPRWGRVSDRVGRKPIIITGLVGYTVGTLLFTSVFYAGLTGLLSGALLYGILIVTRCSQSIVMSATGPGSTAYAADHSSREQRTRTMARLGTANSMGTILGPAVSGALATFGLLAPLYFAAASAGIAALVVWKKLPATPPTQMVGRKPVAKLRYSDRRIALLLLAGIGMFAGFSAIQQTLGFQLQDKLHLGGIETAQMTGAAMMVSAAFSFLMQVTVMQRVQLRPTQFIRVGLLSMLFGAAIVAGFETFTVLAIGMAFLGTGMALCLPSISAGASLAVKPEEQGAAAGLVSSLAAIGFTVGPVCAGLLYQIHSPLAPLFSAVVFFVVLLIVVLKDRQPPGG